MNLFFKVTSLLSHKWCCNWHHFLKVDCHF